MPGKEDAMEEKPKRKLLTVKQCREMLPVGRSSIYRLLEGEPGVHRVMRKGSTRAMILVEPEVIERILRRSAA